MATKKNTQLATIENNTGYLAETVNLAELFSEELDGLRPSFEKIKIPAGGGLAYEVPGDDPASPDSVKEFSAVMKANHVVTKFTLKRAQNSTGIAYSQVVCAVDRPLSLEEKKNIAAMTEQVKLIAGKVSVVETETETVTD